MANNKKVKFNVKGVEIVEDSKKVYDYLQEHKGQKFNAEEIANNIGLTKKQVEGHLGLLASNELIGKIPPQTRNLWYSLD